MKKNIICSCALIVTLLLCLNSCNLVGQQCTPGEIQACYSSDGTEREQTCKSDGSGWESCNDINYSVWCDDETGLCWQNPQKDAYDLEDPGLIQPDAVRYCEELVFGGYDDWRLPDIDEMRTVISGNPPAEAGGACPMTEGSTRQDMGRPKYVDQSHRAPARGQVPATGYLNSREPVVTSRILHRWATRWSLYLQP